MKMAHTYKELNEIAGTWPTVDITNDYVKGSDHFHITCKGKGETVLYQNNDIFNVALCASNYNGMRWKELLRFSTIDYEKASDEYKSDPDLEP